MTDRRQRHPQGARIGGEPAAHMIVQTDRPRHPGHGPAHPGLEVGIAETDPQGIRSRISQSDRFHRHVKHHVVPAHPRQGSQLGRGVGIGQDGHGQRNRQAKDALCGCDVEPDIINHDRDPGSAGRGGRPVRRSDDNRAHI